VLHRLIVDNRAETWLHPPLSRAGPQWMQFPCAYRFGRHKTSRLSLAVTLPLAFVNLQ